MHSQISNLYKNQEKALEISQNQTTLNQKLQDLQTDDPSQQEKLKEIQEISQQNMQNIDNLQKDMLASAAEIQNFYENKLQENQQYKLQVIENIQDISTIDNKVNILKILLPNIDLNDNHLDQLKQIFCQLEDLLQLEIDFSGCKITDIGIKIISQGINHLKSIKKIVLKLKGCGISDNGINNIIQTFWKLEKVSQISCDLEDNNITDQGAHIIGQIIWHLKNVSHLALNLKKNDISNFGWDCVTKELSQIIKNQDSGQASTELTTQQQENFRRFKNIKQFSLNLEENKFSDEGILNLFNTIILLQNVTKLRLNLRKNMLSNGGGQNTRKSIMWLKNIQQLHLDLRDNQISCKGHISLIKENLRQHFIGRELLDLLI